MSVKMTKTKNFHRNLESIKKYPRTKVSNI